MTWDHERVQELLAARALDGLDGDDVARAEEAIAEHVPSCDECRDAVVAFGELAGDLALAAPAAAPPDTLWPRLRRSAAAGPTRRWAGWASAAAVLVLAGGLGVWNLVLTDRLADAQTRQSWLLDAVSSLGHPDAGVVQLSGNVQGRMNVLYVRGKDRMYLVASGMAEPDEGVYRVWLVRHDHTEAAGSFVPDHGAVMLPVERGADDVDRVLLTHEPSDDSPTPAASPLAEAMLGTG